MESNYEWLADLDNCEATILCCVLTIFVLCFDDFVLCFDNFVLCLDNFLLCLTNIIINIRGQIENRPLQNTRSAGRKRLTAGC